MSRPGLPGLAGPGRDVCAHIAVGPYVSTMAKVSWSGGPLSVARMWALT